MCIGDTHFPFAEEKVLLKIYDLAYILKPDYIVQLGDLYDMFSKAKFPRTLNLITPKAEVIKARESAENMWINLQAAAPLAKCFQLKGNHDIRPLKRLIEKAPELEFLYFDDFLFEFEKVETVFDHREVLEIENIYFTHGWLNRLGDHARYFMHNVVTGHTHKGGVVHISDIRRGSKPIFELNCAYSGDPYSVPFSYPATKFTRWIHGVGVIDKYGPRFVPL